MVRIVAGHWHWHRDMLTIGMNSAQTNLGYGRDSGFTDVNSFSDIADGAFGTIGIGYDRQVSKRFVLGAFTDFDISHLSSKNSYEP